MRTPTLRLAIVTVAVAFGVAQPVTRVRAASKGPVTFTRDVAPIFQRACQNCHRAGSIAPMPLLTYEDARPWAKSIRARVSHREMPPWYIDRTVGIQQFKEDPSLRDDEIETIVNWVDAGAPKGDMKDMPAPVQLEDLNTWRIGNPDLIVTSPEHAVPASGADWWGEYVVPTGLTEDRYIKAIQTRAGDIRVVHHAITFAMDDSDTPLESDEYLSEYAVGKQGDIYPEGTGKLLKAGSAIRFTFHYHSIGEMRKDRTQLGFIFYPKGYVPKHVLNVKGLGRVGGGVAGEVDVLDIPAGEVVRHDGYTRLNKAARITGFQPHMHQLGKRQCLELIYPSGKTEMVSCANWDFNWHIAYNYQDDVAPIVPAGTVLHVISYHDNTAGNKAAHDPKNWAGSGNRTIDEMAFAHISWYDLTDQEYEQELAARTRVQKTAEHR